MLLCGIDGTRKARNLGQERRDSSTKLLVTLVELVPTTGTELKGSIVLPFGLALARSGTWEKTVSILVTTPASSGNVPPSRPRNSRAFM